MIQIKKNIIAAEIAQFYDKTFEPYAQSRLIEFILKLPEKSTSWDIVNKGYPVLAKKIIKYFFDEFITHRGEEVKGIKSIVLDNFKNTTNTLSNESIGWIYSVIDNYRDRLIKIIEDELRLYHNVIGRLPLDTGKLKEYFDKKNLELVEELEERNKQGELGKNEKAKNEDENIIKKVCPNCNKPFKTDRNNRKYCSVRCGNRARQAKYHNKKILSEMEKYQKR